MELNVREKAYVNGSGAQSDEGATKTKRLLVYPMFDEAYEVDIAEAEAEGGHGGGDPILQNDIFGIPDPDPLNRAASHVDGAMSIFTGIAANKSIATGMPVDIKTLVEF